MVRIYEIYIVDKDIARFLQDDFLRQFIVRFVLCSTLLHYHNGFKEPQHFPSIYPPLGMEIKEVPEVVAKIQELAGFVNVGGHYHFENK